MIHDFDSKPDFINDEGTKFWLDASVNRYAKTPDANGTTLDNVKERVVTKLPMVWAKEQPRDYSTHCAVCGRKLGKKPVWVEVADGGASVVKPDSCDVSDPGYMGCFPVGSECAKQFAGFAFEMNGTKNNPE